MSWRHWVLLLAMLVMFIAPQAFGDRFTAQKHGQESQGEADAPDRGHFLGEKVDDGRTQQDQEDDGDADGQVDGEEGAALLESRQVNVLLTVRVSPLRSRTTHVAW